MKRNITAKDIINFTFHQWRQHAWKGFAAAAFLGLAVLIDVFVPIVSGKIIDALAETSTRNDEAAGRAWHHFAVFAGLCLSHYAFWTLAVLFWNWFAIYNLFNIVTGSMRKVIRFSADWHANSFAGATVRKITRGMWSFDKFEDTIFFGFYPSLLMVVGMTTMLLYKLPLVGIFTAIMATIFITFSVALSIWLLAPRFKVAAAEDTRVGANLADMMTGISTIKAFAAEDREDARFDIVAHSWRKQSLRSWQTAASSDFVRMLLRMALMTGMMALTIYLWREGRATAGDVTLAITASFIIGGYMRDIGRHVNELQRSASEIEDAVAFWLHENEIADSKDSRSLKLGNGQRGEIVFDNVVFSYGKEGQAIYDGLSVRIEAGEKVALVGLSGSGKSTFVKLIQRLYDIDSGEIRIDGQDIACVTQGSLRRSMALVPQEPILFHRSLAENIAYGRLDATKDDVIRAAKQAHAHDFISKLKDGYDTLVGERGIKLSGGERQRVAIARAILADCPILIMDEATSSLDSVSEHLIQEALETLMEGRTSITIAHRLATIQKVDRILVFNQGRIIEEGSHAELLSREGSAYRHLYQMQALDLVGEGYSEAAE